MYFTNQFDEEDVQIEKAYLLRQNLPKKERAKFKYNPQMDECIQLQDLYHTTDEIREIREVYQDLNYGDFFFVFQNPDFPGLINRPVTIMEALDVWEDMLNLMTDVLPDKESLDQERQGFIKAFVSLKDYQAQSEKNLELKFSESQDFRKDNKFGLSKEEKNLIKKKKKEEEKRKLETLKDYQKKMKKIKEKNLKKNPESNLMAELDKYTGLEKCFSKGGTLILEKNDDEDDFDWIAIDNIPKDFLSLVRNTIITILTQKAFLHCRQFLTLDGEKIIVIIKSNEDILKIVAQETDFKKQLEIGGCDLFSLEPIDDSYRPLRMKGFVTDPDIVREVLPLLRDDEKYNPMSIESRAKQIYQKTQKLDLPDFQKKIVYEKLKVDKWLHKISNQLNIDLPVQDEILEDKEITMLEWQAYYIYLLYLNDYFKRIDSLRKSLDPIFRKEQKLKDEQAIKGVQKVQVTMEEETEQETNFKKKKIDEFEEIRKNLPFIYRLIFLKAKGDANDISYQFNKTFYAKCLCQGEKNKNILKCLWDLLKINPSGPYISYFYSKNSEHIWRRYEINEKGDRSIFSNMEKIKLTNVILLRNLNIFKLIKAGYLESYSPIHDNYQKDGILRMPNFQKLFDAKFLQKKQDTIGQKKLINLFKTLSDHAENIDFDIDGGCLKDDIQFHLFSPWTLDIASIRNYYGEKIALYFLFLSFYTKRLFIMAIWGIAMQIAFNVGIEKKPFIYLAIAFVLINIIWATFFTENWKKQQQNFAIEFGQTENEDSNAIRPAFEGTFIRSIDNDDLNEEYYSTSKRTFKMILSYIVSLGIIGIVVFIIILLLFLREILKKKEAPTFFVSTLPSFINSIQIFIFNAIYQSVALFTNDYENHKYLQSYENSLVLKIFSFQFVNTFISFFMISFLNSVFEDYGVPTCPDIHNGGFLDKCYSTLEIQMRTIFIVTIIKNLPELILPWFKAFKKKLASKADDDPQEQPFMDIDRQIEKDYYLEAYATNLEVDGTVGDYMELIIQYGFLNIFSLAFPLSYTLAFVNNVLEIQVDKLKLMMFSRRPIPNNAADIGTWFYILDLITFISIFTNAALLCFTSKVISRQDRYLLFTSLVLIFLTLKYFLRILLPDISQKAKNLLKRHKFVEERVVKGFKRSQKNNIRNEKINMKIEGLAPTNNEILQLATQRSQNKGSPRKNPRKISSIQQQ